MAFTILITPELSTIDRVAREQRPIEPKPTRGMDPYVCMSLIADACASFAYGPSDEEIAEARWRWRLFIRGKGWGPARGLLGASRGIRRALRLMIRPVLRLARRAPRRPQWHSMKTVRRLCRV